MMKKTSIILLVLFLCLNLYSCKNNNEEGCGGDPSAVKIESMEEYKQTLTSLKLPNNFLYYDDLKAFGEFDYFELTTIFSKDDLDKEFSTYKYGFNDNLDMWVSVQIRSDEPIKGEPEKNYIYDKASKDMRLFNEELSGYYTLGEIEYVYQKGKLSGIIYMHGGHRYWIDAHFSEYPETEETIIGKLLNSDTAVETIESVFDFEADNALKGG